MYTRENKKWIISSLIIHCWGGTAGSRTQFQTFAQKAFYMLILVLIFVTAPELNQPRQCLATLFSQVYRSTTLTILFLFRVRRQLQI